MTESLNQPKNNWLKWIILVPSVILSYLLMSPFVKIMCDLVWQWNEGGFLYRYLIPFLAGWTTGTIPIITAKSIAPSYKNNVILITMLIILSFNGITLFSNKSYPETGYSPITEIIAISLGAITTYLTFRDKPQ